MFCFVNIYIGYNQSDYETYNDKNRHIIFSVLDLTLEESGYEIADSVACKDCYVDMTWVFNSTGVGMHILVHTNDEISPYVCKNYTYDPDMNVSIMDCNEGTYSKNIVSHILVMAFETLDEYTNTFLIVDVKKSSKGKAYHLFDNK